MKRKSQDSCRFFAAIVLLFLSTTLTETASGAAEKPRHDSAIRLQLSASSAEPPRLVSEIQHSRSEDSRQQQQEEINGTLTQSELLIKQSNLQAEESQSDGLGVAAIVEAPPDLARQRQPVRFSGGSGNSFMWLTRDGSKRYEFGYDTGDKDQQQVSSPKAPRLMREESRLEDGTVIGRYGYTDPFGAFRIVQYVAGAEGYFASEEVGAVQPSANQVPGERNNRQQFQLNRNLRRALEEARAKRSSSQHRSEFKKRSSGVLEAGGGGQELHLAAASESTEVAAAAASDRSDSELEASGSSHHSTRYATRINHVIGHDGRSYATAFRPQIVSNQPRVAFTAPTTLEGVELSRRSKLPAPIYTPLSAPIGEQSSSSYNIVVDHGGASNLWHTTAPEPEQTTPEEAPSQLSPLTRAAYTTPPDDVLRSSQAWSIIDNNYGGQHHSLLIDHSAWAGQPAYKAAAAQLRHNVAGEVGGQIESNFEHEARLLRSLQSQRGRRFGDSKLAQQPQQTHWTQQSAASARPEPTGYANFGTALKQQFDPPLYHPEVHETAAFVEKPTSVYASTIVHSEVAAEQSYAPLRIGQQQQQQFAQLQPSGRQEYDLLQRSGSELRPIETNHSPLVPSTPIPSSSTTTTTAPTLARTIASLEQFPRQTASKPYATRLRPSEWISPTSSAKRIDESLEDSLLMENSDQVTTTYTAANSSSATSRARLPDRTKKLSSIFKSRTAPGGGVQTSPGGDPTAARIRRPIPSNARRQPAAPVVVTAAPVEFPQQDKSSNAAVAAPQADIGNPEQPREEKATTVIVSASSEASVRAPELIVHVDTRLGENEATATAATANEAKASAIDRSLYEKIVRIQQEIAAKSRSSTLAPLVPTFHSTSRPLPEPAAPSSTSAPTSTQAPSTTTTTSTTIPPTSTPATTTTTSTSTTTTTTSTTTTTARPTTTSSTTVAPTTTTTASPELATSTTRRPDLASDQIQGSEAPLFLTGPILETMDSHMERDNFMAKLNSFDSARAQTLSSTNSTRSSLASTAEPSSASTSTETIKDLPAPQTDRPKDQLVENVAAPSPAIGGNFSSPVSVSSPETPFAPTRNESNILVVSTTVMPQTTSDSAGQPTADLTSSGPTNVESSNLTSAVLLASERVPKSKKLAKSLVDQKQPRLIRVIKKDGKIVARLNASEPIPDSMIPINGNDSDQVILPDMPRGGLRRSSKTRRLTGGGGGGLQSLRRLPDDIERRKANETSLGSPAATTVAPPAASAANTTTTGGETTNSTLLVVAESRSVRVARLDKAPGRIGLSRGPRSQRAATSLNAVQQSADGESDLMVAESGEDQRRSSPTATRTNVFAAPRQAPNRAGWSSRLRENISRSASSPGSNLASGANKIYDSNEDLRKMVAKISSIEATRPSTIAQFAGEQQSTRRPAANRSQAELGPSDPDDIPRRSDRLQVGYQNATSVGQDVPTKNLTQTNSGEGNSVSGTAKLDGDQEKVSINSMLSSVLSPSNLNVTENLKEGSQPTTTTVATTTTSTTTTTTTTAIPTTIKPDSRPVMFFNQSQISPPKVNLSSIIASNLSSIQSSRSSSASFTVTVSPTIEKKWEQLKPIEVDQLARVSEKISLVGATSNSSIEHPATKKEIRIDSRGHIHVRHNQSITIHVDIEPPHINSTGSAAKLLEQQPKRLKSRDTTSQTVETTDGLFGKNDIRRLDSQSSAVPSQLQTTSSAGPSQNLVAVSQPIEPVSGDATKSRMLCIEVEQDQMSKLGAKLQ